VTTRCRTCTGSSRFQVSNCHGWRRTLLSHVPAGYSVRSHPFCRSPSPAKVVRTLRFTRNLVNRARARPPACGRTAVTGCSNLAPQQLSPTMGPGRAGRGCIAVARKRFRDQKRSDHARSGPWCSTQHNTDLGAAHGAAPDGNVDSAEHGEYKRTERSALAHFVCASPQRQVKPCHSGRFAIRKYSARAAVALRAGPPLKPHSSTSGTACPYPQEQYG
jgi:hypothetical protein